MDWSKLDFWTRLNAWLDAQIGERSADMLVICLVLACFVAAVAIPLYKGDTTSTLVNLSVALFVFGFTLGSREGYF